MQPINTTGSIIFKKCITLTLNLKGSAIVMRTATRSMMTWGAIGAIAGMALIPAISPKTRKKVSRSARNAYFRVSDMMQDIKDMGHR